jgi:hypothetical protein
MYNLPSSCSFLNPPVTLLLCPNVIFITLKRPQDLLFDVAVKLDLST